MSDYGLVYPIQDRPAQTRNAEMFIPMKNPHRLVSGAGCACLSNRKPTHIGSCSCLANVGKDDQRKQAEEAERSCSDFPAAMELS